MTYFWIVYVIVVIVIAYFNRNKDTNNGNLSNSTVSNSGSLERKGNKGKNKPGNREIFSTPVFMALKEMNLQFEEKFADNGNIIYRFPIKTVHMNTDVIIMDRVGEKSISMMIRNPVLIPELMRSAVFEFIGIINYSYEYGAFEMDHKAGEIRLRSGLTIEDRNKMPTEIIINWLNDLFAMMDTTFPGFIAVAYGNAIPSEMWDKIQNSPDPKLN